MSDVDAVSGGDAVACHGEVSADAPSARKKLACSQCRQRKVKCDREHPCLPCVSTGRECTSVPSPAPRRPRRQNHHKIRERLESLEALLQECAKAEQDRTSQTEIAPATGIALLPKSPSAPAPIQPLNYPSPQSSFVEAGNGGHELTNDNNVSSRIFQDLRAIKAVLEVEAEQETWLPLPPSTDPAQLRGFGLAVLECIPTPEEVVLLWGIFLDRVDPVTKIIHVPTFRSNVVEAVADFCRAPLPTQALVFSVFLAATTSLSRREHQDLFRKTKSESTSALIKGFKAVMAQLDYFNTFNVDIVKALIFFSLARQGPRHNPCVPWILHGLVSNLSYCLGLHVDPAQPGTPPFAVEMRRRLWWQVVKFDARHSVATGVGTFLMLTRSSTKLPANLDDHELQPNMQAIPKGHNGSTEMSYCLLVYESCSLLADRRRYHGHGLVNFDESGITSIEELTSTNSIETRDEMIPRNLSQAHRLLLELAATAARELAPLARQRCPDVNNPLHVRMVQSHVCIDLLRQTVCTPMQEVPEWGVEVHGPDDNNFRLSVASTEFRQEKQRVLGHKFAWYAKIGFTLPGLVRMVDQLHDRLSGSLADRAWACVERAYEFHEELWDFEDVDILTLGNSVITAWARRQGYFLGKRIPLPEPSVVTRLRAEVSMTRAQAMNLVMGT